MLTRRSSRSLFAPLVPALLLLAAETLAAQAPAGVPVFAFDKTKSSIGFDVKASVPITGKFDKWDATLTFTSPVSRLAFWTSRLRRLVSIPEAA